MIRRSFLTLPLLWPGVALAAEVTDSVGRVVNVPDRVARVLPAGPPAAVLLAALAPDLLFGWPGPLSDETRALLPAAAARQPRIPRLTGREDVTERIAALKPGLILDYGAVTPRYLELAEATQRRTGIPAVLFNGAMDQIPRTLRAAGAMLHREERAETLAVLAETLLALPPAVTLNPRVLYARGTNGLTVTAPDTEVTEVFTHLGWQVVAPEGKGMFRPSSIEAIRALAPDILIFSDPTMREPLTRDEAWRAIRAVREGRAHVAPAQPFGWIEEPPSINRLLGLAWLRGHEPASLAALFHAVVYGRALTPTQLDTVLAGVRPLQP